MESRLPNTDLIIFDCDGVLVDSEVLSCGCLSEILHECGVELSIEQVLRLFLGRSTADVIAYCRTAGKALPKDFLTDLALRVRETFQCQLEPIAGVGTLLSELRIPFCVASSSDLERVSFSLRLTGLGDHFGDRVYTSQMVRCGKPAPDLFLYAAAAMGSKPDRTLVIEDSVSGVMAAKAAGMKVWGFVGGAHYRYQSNGLLQDAGADRIFDRIADFWTEG
jgi:HAD superfamily hydrolase (TIGR01509 family)